MRLWAVWRVYKGATVQWAREAAQVHPLRMVRLLDETFNQDHRLLESTDLLADSLPANTDLNSSLFPPVYPDPAILLVQASVYSK